MFIVSKNENKIFWKQFSQKIVNIFAKAAVSFMKIRGKKYIKSVFRASDVLAKNVFLADCYWICNGSSYAAKNEFEIWNLPNKIRSNKISSLKNRTYLKTFYTKSWQSSGSYKNQNE